MKSASGMAGTRDIIKCNLESLHLGSQIGFHSQTEKLCRKGAPVSLRLLSLKRSACQVCLWLARVNLGSRKVPHSCLIRMVYCINYVNRLIVWKETHQKAVPDFFFLFAMKYCAIFNLTFPDDI